MHTSGKWYTLQGWEQNICAILSSQKGWIQGLLGEKEEEKKKNKTLYLRNLALCTSHGRGNTGRGRCNLAAAVLELFARSLVWRRGRSLPTLR